MQVKVAILPEARQELLALLSVRTQSEADAIRFGYTYLEDMEQQFVDADGLPPGSRRLRTRDGIEWWWRYVNGVWVVYQIEDRMTWLFGAVVRTVTVIAFEADAPAP